MASVTITNLGGSIRLQDVRFYPDITDVEILKDGLVLTQFGDICRIRFTNGIPFDATFDEYEIIGFDGSVIPTTTQECYDAIWAVLADYGNTSSGDCCACEESSYRLLEDGSLRLLEEGCVRLLEDDGGGDSESLSYSAGVMYGMEVTVNGVDNSKFDVSAGRYVIVDYWTDPTNPPVVYDVTYAGSTSNTITNIATQDVTFIFFDTAGAIVQSAVPSDSITRRELFYSSQIGHTNGVSIGAIINRPDTFRLPIQQLRDLEEALGSTINNGVYVYANGANLLLNNTSGKLYLNGVNFHNDQRSPSFLPIAAGTNISWRYRTQTGNGSTVSTIDPTSYDNAGTITTIAGNNATNQQVYLTGGGNYVIQYGQTIYSTLADAKEAASELFTVFPNLLTNAIRIGVISILKNCTDLTDSNRAHFTPADRFGNVGASVGGGGVFAGITSLNAQTGVSQTFANGSAGTAPAFNSASDVHTLDIPLASGIGVTAGLISKTSFDAFTAKLSPNAPITPNTKTKIQYDANGLIVAGSDAAISDITGLTTALGTKLNTSDLTRVLLMTQTAAASASIDFENLFTGAYSRFELEYDNVIPSLPSTLNFCIGIGSGPVVYQNGASDYSWFMRRYINNGSGTVATNLYAADNADTNVILYLFSSTTIESFSGKITFLNPFDASIKAKFLHETFCIYNIGVGNYLTTGNAFYKSTGSLITGMRIKLDSGTLTSGTFRLYGIK
jgi:hypothetical protein